MKAVRITAPGRVDESGRIIADGQVQIDEMDRPVRKQGEALVKLLYGGICGSDAGTWRGTFAYAHYPLIPGHEFSAQIVEVDEDNPQGLKRGMIVTCNPYMNCGECYSCRHGHVNACMNNQTLGCQCDGAFREYFTIPAERCYDGSGIDPKLLALVEPFCISWHGIRRADIQKGETVLVVGAGTIGVLAAAAAKERGAIVYIADVLEQKLQMAASLGLADGTILCDPADPAPFLQRVRKITGEENFIAGDGQPHSEAKGFDVTVEAVGLPSTFQNCIDAVSFGGRMVLIGVGKERLDFDFTVIQKKELTVLGSRNALREDFLEVLELIRSGRAPLEGVITDYYELEEAPEAFRAFAHNRGSMLKTLIHFADPE